jgi:hypothetical protein
MSSTHPPGEMSRGSNDAPGDRSRKPAAHRRDARLDNWHSQPGAEPVHRVRERSRDRRQRCEIPGRSWTRYGSSRCGRPSGDERDGLTIGRERGLEIVRRVAGDVHFLSPFDPAGHRDFIVAARLEEKARTLPSGDQVGQPENPMSWVRRATSTSFKSSGDQRLPRNAGRARSLESRPGKHRARCGVFWKVGSVSLDSPAIPRTRLPGSN